MKQHNQYWINNRLLHQHPQTRPATPLQGKVELQFDLQGEIPSVLLYPQTKPLRQLCLRTVEASKRASVSCRGGGGLTVRLCWLTLTRRFYLGGQADCKKRSAMTSMTLRRTPICLLSKQMTARGPAALQACSALSLPLTPSLLKSSWVKVFNVSTVGLIKPFKLLSVPLITKCIAWGCLNTSTALSRSWEPCRGHI